MALNLPNRITVARMVLVPVFLVAFLEAPMPTGAWISLIIFVVAAITDRIDGKIARDRGLVTTFGMFLDPLADKLLVVSALFCLVYAGFCSPYVGIIITARELIVTSFRIIAMKSGVTLAADKLGKIKTFLQFTSILLALIAVIYTPLSFAADLLLWAAAFITIYSGWHYLSQNWACIGNDM